MSEYQGPTQPRTPLKVVEPGTPEHGVWKEEQARKRSLFGYKRILEDHPMIEWKARTTFIEREDD